MKQCALMAVLLTLLWGCSLRPGSPPAIDRAAPFEAEAALRIGERQTAAQLRYAADGSLTLDMAPEPLKLPLRQVATDGGTEVSVGEHHFSYPADWAGVTALAGLVRQALRAPEAAVEVRSGVPTLEGSAAGIPFVIESSADGNILLRIAFPTLDAEIALSDFRRGG